MTVEEATLSGTGGSGSSSDQGEQFVSLYRRFRPGRFSELRGQPHVVRALQSAVRDDHVSHAYLFSGPRGTGKTSSARILARALNCAQPVDGEPCGTCTSCVEIARGTSLDVHELDAASNNGVDAMRDLISHAALGTPGRWKVYIVDEVHMLSMQAANALLKTLEEPPSHVVFVLATTDPQKVQPTIRSRTQHFEFRLFGADALSGLLRDVRDQAHLDIDDEALAVAVRRGRGSARDALSALDQVAAGGSVDDVRPEVDTVIEAVCDEDASAVLVIVGRLVEAGWGIQQLSVELVDELRQAFLVVMAPELAVADGSEANRYRSQVERMGLAKLVRSIESLGRAQVEMRDTPDPRVVLEVALVKLARPELDESSAALLDRIARLERAVAGGGVGAGPSRAAASPASARPPLADAPDAAAPEAAPTPTPAPTPAAPAGAPDSGFKPSFGAIRKQRQSAQAGPPVEPAAAASAAGAPAEAVPPPAARTVAVVDSSPTAGSKVVEPPDRDAIVEAWGDHVQRTLPAKARALYGAGRFVSAEGGKAIFALPNSTHRDKSVEVKGAVEQALSAHFGTPIRLELVVAPDAGDGGDGGDGGGGGGGRSSGRPASSTTPVPSTGSSVLDEDVLGDVEFDPDDPGDPGAVESLAEERLFQAFPGAQEVSS